MKRQHSARLTKLEKRLSGLLDAAESLPPRWRESDPSTWSVGDFACWLNEQTAEDGHDPTLYSEEIDTALDQCFPPHD